MTSCELNISSSTLREHVVSTHRARVENHFESCRALRLGTYELNPIAKASKIPDHLSGTLLLPLASDSRTTLLILNALVENLPNQSAQPMRDRADGLSKTQSRHQSLKHQLKNTAFGLHSSIGRLIEYATHLAVALW
jgi:hypothetical protein